MPVIVDDNSTIAEQIRYRRPRNNQPIPETDPNPPQIPSIIQSTRCKSTISSLLLSTFNTTTTTPKKKNFTSGTFRGLGCAAAASSKVSVPAVIRNSANWEAKKVRKKKQRKNKPPNQAVVMPSNNNNPSSSSAAASTSVIVVPDVWCGPGIGFTTDASSVDCVVSRRTVSGRSKVDGEKLNQRERLSYSTRRTVRSEPMSFMDSDHSFGMMHPGLDVFGARYHRHDRHRSPDGLAEIMMLQSSLMMGGRSDGFDRYRDWRLDVDNMSYEEDYEAEDETGKLECGHFYHIHCIRQWLVQKNTCPICKTEAAAAQE
ncbi:uncharacterized protein LOC114261031 isoform X2 [Camellia sinensis]|uniref:uncharacterized protein LOC114261031 isoform X2 n=1 Tax=Camellia sinensis TaxID=4442 RepID=UPI0010355245|nr:uncharacterized protein LOC114261031 isoform X2 [Camellia sinensis]